VQGLSTSSLTYDVLLWRTWHCHKCSHESSFPSIFSIQKIPV
jgi:hypothetical protein